MVNEKLLAYVAKSTIKTARGVAAGIEAIANDLCERDEQAEALRILANYVYVQTDADLNLFGEAGGNEALTEEVA